MGTGPNPAAQLGSDLSLGSEYVDLMSLNHESLAATSNSSSARGTRNEDESSYANFTTFSAASRPGDNLRGFSGFDMDPSLHQASDWIPQPPSSRRISTSLGKIPPRIVSRKNRVKILALEWHVPERFLRAVCERIVAKRDGSKEVRETIVSW